MLYLYDKSIVKDLTRSFNPNHIDNPVVKVIDPEGAISIAAQIQNDEISFPIVALTRDDDINVDTDRMNFTLAKKGIVAGFDPKKNIIYKEKVIPLNLTYHLTLLTTSTADMDELIKELIFKYSDMYYLTIKLPYEVDRKIRFGFCIDKSSTIQRTSSEHEYLNEGKLHQSIITLKTEGCVLVSYTPVHMKRIEYRVDATN